MTDNVDLFKSICHGGSSLAVQAAIQPWCTQKLHKLMKGCGPDAETSETCIRIEDIKIDYLLGATPLISAVYMGDVEMVKHLTILGLGVRAGCSVSLRDGPQPLTEYTALEIASMAGHKQVV
jgi:hypothetical protein